MVLRLHLRELLVLELELRDEGCTQQLQLAKLLLEPAHPRLECVGLGLGCRLPPAARAPPPAPSGLATPSHSRTTHFPFPLTTDPDLHLQRGADCGVSPLVGMLDAEPQRFPIHLVGRSEVGNLAALEAAGSSTRGGGGAPSGPASFRECRAARSCPEPPGAP